MPSGKRVYPGKLEDEEERGDVHNKIMLEEFKMMFKFEAGHEMVTTLIAFTSFMVWGNECRRRSIETVVKNTQGMGYDLKKVGRSMAIQ